ncbi:MAG TPA: dihydropteroate synthase [Dissulfurispiraceae bacterium]|nr:dihydropteroate synthase [Dissulfurispiraceae bacterium]
MILSWNGFSLDFTGKTHIMGVLNITPDSFSDGGFFFDKEKAVRQAHYLIDNGADILDIGGESTRPGAAALPAAEELKRTIPVIQAVARSVHIPVSIDTCKAEVARRALDAGASMVNDISGLRFDPAMSHVVAEYGVPVIVMHIKGTPKDMQENPVYEALIPEILDYLRCSIRLAADSGIPEERVVIDPGIGFGKTFYHNLEIIKNLKEFTLLGRPVAIGVSRKAFIGKLLGGAPPSARMEGTAAAVAVSIVNGAHIVRVHDVKEMTKVARVADAIKKA